MPHEVRDVKLSNVRGSFRSRSVRKKLVTLLMNHDCFLLVLDGETHKQRYCGFECNCGPSVVMLVFASKYAILREYWWPVTSKVYIRCNISAGEIFYT
jgi:hypothetical protein